MIKTTNINNNYYNLISETETPEIYNLNARFYFKNSNLNFQQHTLDHMQKCENIDVLFDNTDLWNSWLEFIPIYDDLTLNDAKLALSFIEKLKTNNIVPIDDSCESFIMNDTKCIISPNNENFLKKDKSMFVVNVIFAKLLLNGITYEDIISDYPNITEDYDSMVSNLRDNFPDVLELVFYNNIEYHQQTLGEYFKNKKDNKINAKRNRMNKINAKINARKN